MSDCQHLAIQDGTDMVCTHCGVELRLASPWENPDNWGGMSRDEYDKARKWVPVDQPQEED